MREVSQDLMETVAPHLSPPVKRLPGGIAADNGDGAEISQGTLLVLLLLYADDGN
jgi:hypothetical protein